MSQSPKPSLVVCSRIRVKPDYRKEVVDAALRVSKVCEDTAGCLEYTVTEDAADPGGVVIFELWSDPSAITFTFQTDEVCEFKETLRRLKAQEPDTKRYRLAA